MIRNFCWHQNFVPKGLSVSALGLYTCIKSFKMCLKSYFIEIVLKLATNGQSDKGFLLTSTFVPKGLSAPALGLYTCIKALKYVPGLGVRWAFTGPLVLWLGEHSVSHLCTYQCFPPEDGGWDYPRELNNFEKLGSNSLPMWHNFVSKIPWMGLQI